MKWKPRSLKGLQERIRVVPGFGIMKIQMEETVEHEKEAGLMRRFLGIVVGGQPVSLRRLFRILASL